MSILGTGRDEANPGNLQSMFGERALSSPVGEGDELVERLYRLMERATRRPWIASDGNVYAREDDPPLFEGHGLRQDDATLIVEAVNALPALLDRLSTPPHDRATIEPEDGRSPASQGRAATASPPSPAVSGIAGIPNAGDQPYKIASFLTCYRVVGKGTWFGDFGTINEAVAARDLLNDGFDGSRQSLYALAKASGIEARSDATGTGAAEGESPARSEAKGDAHERP